MGGIGGFFQQRFVEVDARRRRPAHRRLRRGAGAPTPEPDAFAAAARRRRGRRRGRTADPVTSPTDAGSAAPRPSPPPSMPPAGRAGALADRELTARRHERTPFAERLDRRRRGPRAAVRRGDLREADPPRARTPHPDSPAAPRRRPRRRLRRPGLDRLRRRARRAPTSAPAATPRAVATLEQARDAASSAATPTPMLALDLPPIAAERAEVDALAERVATLQLDELVAVLPADARPADRPRAARPPPAAERPRRSRSPSTSPDAELGAAARARLHDAPAARLRPRRGTRHRPRRPARARGAPAAMSADGRHGPARRRCPSCARTSSSRCPTASSTAAASRRSPTHEIVVVLMLDAREALALGDASPMSVEFPAPRGLVRLEGRGTVATHDLVRFHHEGAVDVVQRRDFVRVRVVRPLAARARRRGRRAGRVGRDADRQRRAATGCSRRWADPSRSASATPSRSACARSRASRRSRAAAASRASATTASAASRSSRSTATRAAQLVRFVFEQERIARQRTRDGELRRDAWRGQDRSRRSARRQRPSRRRRTRCRASRTTRAPARRSRARRRGAGSAASCSSRSCRWRAGVADRADALLRALAGGVVGYVAAWACAVAVWRHLVVAELRAVRRHRAPPRPPSRGRAAAREAS